MGIFQIDFLTLWLISLSLIVTAAPTPDKNGICASYIIQGYDTCGLIAKAHGITEADIESFNKQTWSWLGCNQLYQGDFICLSAGKPPMPMALPQATCGPQVPGTVRPKNWADLMGLNPCPAPQCCTWWGRCSNTRSSCELGGREPPAGATATVKAATEPPKKTATKAAGTKATTAASQKTKATTSTKTTQLITHLEITSTKTTSKTTSKKSTTTTKTDTTGQPPSLPHAYVPENQVGSTKAYKKPWEITMYSKKNCKGDYYHLQGYNSKHNDTQSHCLTLRDGLNSVFTEEGVTCKWWTNGGFTSAPCDKSRLLKPESWFVKNGYCTIFKKKDCDCYDGWRVYVRNKGCQNRDSRDPPEFNALMCAMQFTWVGIWYI